MQKPLLIAAAIFAVGCALPDVARAQQTPVPSAPTADVPSSAPSAADKELPTQKEQSSYALGMNFADDLKMHGINATDIDMTALLRGFQDIFAGKKLLMTDEQLSAALSTLGTEAQKRQGENNMKEGADFLAANKTKDGVVVLPSGLQYKIITAGTGAKPGPTDTVVCNYRGTLINGTEFDSSYKRGQPASFPVNRVIAGWTEALQMMPVGSNWQLFIPSNLAYGERGAGGSIGPNATLIFEVELLSIQGK
jgi:FKBP-type peptidyl-prolyl cis-trans isomerase FklB